MTSRNINDIEAMSNLANLFLLVANPFINSLPFDEELNLGKPVQL